MHCGAGRSSSPIWSCSAWGLPCHRHHCLRGALLPHLFTLTPPCSGGLQSPAVTLKKPAVTNRRYRGGAVYFLWYFPCQRRTSRNARNPPLALAVSEHTALRSSDFPLLRIQDCKRDLGQRSSDRPACSRIIIIAAAPGANQPVRDAERRRPPASERAWLSVRLLSELAKPAPERSEGVLGVRCCCACWHVDFVNHVCDS
jgi:hypothetical protein